MHLVRRRLAAATAQERIALRKCLGAADDTDAEIIRALQKSARSKFDQWLGEDLSYSEVLETTITGEVRRIPPPPLPGGRLGYVRFGERSAQVVLERCVAEQAYQEYRNSLSPEERARLDKGIEETRSKFMSQHRDLLVGAGGVLLASQLLAQASGFGIYLFASSFLAGAGSLFGLTLPFGMYQALSTVIATSISPLAIFLGAGVLAWSLLRRDKSRTAQGVFHLYAIRSRRELELLVVLGGSDSPQDWFQPLRSCFDSAARLRLWEELGECFETLGRLPSFWILAGTLEHVRGDQSRGELLNEGFRQLQENPNWKVSLEGAADGLFEATKKYRPSALEGTIVDLIQRIPATVRRGYRHSDEGGQAHFDSTFIIVGQILEIVGKGVTK
jgi:hypothetical protein